jgi:hypothetical protein
MARTFGWKKDKRDERDYIHMAAAEPLKEIPQEYSLYEFAPSVRDQLKKNSCTGFGFGGLLTLLARFYDYFIEWFSPEWIYNGGRWEAGDLSHDNGCYPRDNCQWILDYGALLEHFRPYRSAFDPTSPLDWTYEGKSVMPEAAKWRIVAYHRITGGALNVCDAIAKGNPVALGIPWYASWMDIGRDGMLPEDYRQVVGGHEVFAYGYDLIDKRIFCQNSWGKDYGDNGRFYLPFSAFDHFLNDGGYDAHYFVVEPDDYEPDPAPVPTKKFSWWLLVAALALAALLAVVL